MSSSLVRVWKCSACVALLPIDLKESERTHEGRLDYVCINIIQYK